jgi:hypothetical protein
MYAVTEGLLAVIHYLHHVKYQRIYRKASELVLRFFLRLHIWISITGGLTLLVPENFTASWLAGVVLGSILVWGLTFTEENEASNLNSMIDSDDIVVRSIGLMQFIDEHCKQSSERSLPLDAYIHYHRSRCPCATCPLFQLIDDRGRIRDPGKVVPTLIRTLIKHLKTELPVISNRIQCQLFTVGYILHTSHNYIYGLEVIQSLGRSKLDWLSRFVLFSYQYEWRC